MKKSPHFDLSKSPSPSPPPVPYLQGLQRGHRTVARTLAIKDLLRWRWRLILPKVFGRELTSPFHQLMLMLMVKWWLVFMLMWVKCRNLAISPSFERPFTMSWASCNRHLSIVSASLVISSGYCLIIIDKNIIFPEIWFFSHRCFLLQRDFLLGRTVIHQQIWTTLFSDSKMCIQHFDFFSSWLEQIRNIKMQGIKMHGTQLQFCSMLRWARHNAWTTWRIQTRIIPCAGINQNQSFGSFDPNSGCWNLPGNVSQTWTAFGCSHRNREAAKLIRNPDNQCPCCKPA